MSSILRALKKLENEPRHLDETRPLDSKFVSLADTELQRPVSKIFIMVVGTGVVCGLVVLAGWWLFSKKNQLPPAVTQKIPQQSSKLEESPSLSFGVNKVEDSAVSEKTEKLSMKIPETPKATDQAMESQPSNFEKPALRVTGQENIPPVETKRQQETILTQEVLNEQVTQTAEKTVAASLSAPATPIKTVKAEIPKLRDPDMKLQAVTWSRVPQKRITVINNRILREGDMVSGYLIKAINQDDVVLSQEGTKWKLLFR